MNYFRLIGLVGEAVLSFDALYAEIHHFGMNLDLLSIRLQSEDCHGGLRNNFHLKFVLNMLPRCFDAQGFLLG